MAWAREHHTPPEVWSVPSVLAHALKDAGFERHALRLDVELELERGAEAATIVVVNETAEARNIDANMRAASGLTA